MAALMRQQRIEEGAFAWQRNEFREPYATVKPHILRYAALLRMRGFIGDKTFKGHTVGSARIESNACGKAAIARILALAANFAGCRMGHSRNPARAACVMFKWFLYKYVL